MKSPKRLNDDELNSILESGLRENEILTGREKIHHYDWLEPYINEKIKRLKNKG